MYNALAQALVTEEHWHYTVQWKCTYLVHIDNYVIQVPYVWSCCFTIGWGDYEAEKLVKPGQNL